MLDQSQEKASLMSPTPPQGWGFRDGLQHRIQFLAASTKAPANMHIEYFLKCFVRTWPPIQQLT